MTITLPYPTPAGEAFADNDGGNGLNSPPVGAPEGNPTESVNDIQRRDKTAIRQNVDNYKAINTALGTMAEQDADSVAITGGNIGAGVSVAGAVNSLQFGGVTAQDWYDALLPVGTVQLRAVFSPPVAPAGLSATWALVTGSDGRVLRMTEASPPLTTGGSDTRTTTATALTEAQIPAHDHKLITSGSTGTSNLPGANDSIARELTGIGDPDYRMTSGTGSATNGASSTVGSGDGHDHMVTVLPRYMELAAYQRTA